MTSDSVRGVLAACAFFSVPLVAVGCGESVGARRSWTLRFRRYPEDARAARIEGTVELRLTVRADGTVKEAEVVGAAGHGFDEAAREAALRFHFDPATRDGQLIAARILYRYEFRLPPEPGPAPAPGTAPPLEPPPITPAPSPSKPASPSEPPPQPRPVEVVVRGRQTKAQQLRQSAEAVTVVSTRRAQQQSSDLGEVMARTQGVSVRRSGGLGSGARFSLNGLEDAQIPFFLDGVPLELAGYPFGIANVPVNLVERIEIYRGVVPIRFGADALGGAVHLVTDAHYTTRLSASYQVGSFGTHRLTVASRYRHEPGGFVAGGSAFFDVARNDYLVDVKVGGDLHQATVPRFHDRYLARGGSVEVGVVDVPWANRLLLRGFATIYDKELQNDLTMKSPYGEATYGETAAGATLRYEQPLLSNLELHFIGTYAHRELDFLDKSQWNYDWYGRRISRIDHDGVGPAGEVNADQLARDQTQWQRSGLARATLAWRITPEHTLRLSVAPTFTRRTGEERIPSSASLPELIALTVPRELFTLVSGIEYEVHAWPMPGAQAGATRDPARDDRVQNILFLKGYLMHVSSQERLYAQVFRPVVRDERRAGVGDSLRFRFSDGLYAKASYELATRLPSPDEMFGVALIDPNFDLVPEKSHNANLGSSLEMRRLAIGDVTADINGFLRESDEIIRLLGNERTNQFQYQNVHGARTLGVESQLGWASPKRWLSLDGSITYQDVRNTSSTGALGRHEGDRIPNQPWLFASWGARARISRLLAPDDELEPFYVGRYVHDFLRSWVVSENIPESIIVQTQITHGVGVTYTLRADVARVSTTVEIQNIANARVFDFYRVQRPGRAFYLKTTGELW